MRVKKGKRGDIDRRRQKRGGRKWTPYRPERRSQGRDSGRAEGVHRTHSAPSQATVALNFCEAFKAIYKH